MDDVKKLVYEVEKALSDLFPLEYSGLYLYDKKQEKLETIAPSLKLFIKYYELAKELLHEEVRKLSS